MPSSAALPLALASPSAFVFPASMTMTMTMTSALAVMTACRIVVNRAQQAGFKRIYRGFDRLMFAQEYLHAGGSQFH